MAQLSFFFFQLREVVTVVEDLQSLLAFGKFERLVVCALCVNVAFAVPSCSFVSLLPAGLPASTGLWALWRGNPHAH